MRHNFNGNIVYTSTSNSSTNAVVRELLNGNEIGVLLQFNSGLPREHRRRTCDLNGDGVAAAIVRWASRATRSTCRRARTWTCATRASIPIARLGARRDHRELKNVFNTEQLRASTPSSPRTRPATR